MHSAAFGIDMHAGAAARKVMHSLSVAAAMLALLRFNRCFIFHRLMPWCRVDYHGGAQ